MPDTRPDLTGHPAALFVFSNLREQKGGLTRAWLRRLTAFHEAGWDTHIATIHPQPEIDATLDAWRERGWLPTATSVHHYQRRNKRFRPSWSRRTDESFTRDDRVADWLDWLVGRLPGVVVFADSPVTYAPVAMMRNPYVGRIVTVHLAHRKRAASSGEAGAEAGAIRSRRARQIRSRYAGPVGQPRLSGRLLPFAGAVDAVVALTHKQAADLAEDLPGLEVHVIPNMVDPVAPDLVPVRDPLRVVQLGRLDAVKRVDHAIRAVGIAARTVPDLRLEIYGRGPELEHLMELRRELGLEGVVSFPGFTEDPLMVLAGAAVSLMTSRREGFGLAVAESLAAGTPVVTYDVDYGPAELVSDGVNGRVVADGSVEDLAAALVDVVSDPVAWGRMSGAAPAAAERLRPDVVAAQWLDLAVEVAARVAVPSSCFVVEDLRVRRGGLDVEGVVIGPVVLPGWVGIVGGADVPLSAIEGLSPGASDAGRSSGPIARDVRATLPWPAVADWPDAAAVSARTGQGASMPVIGPGLPVTAAPTEAGVVLVGWDDQLGVVHRVEGPDPVPVTGRLTSLRAAVGDDVTVLSELPIARARVVGSRATATDLQLQLLPGLCLTGDSELAVAAGAGEHSVRVGRFRLSERDPGSRKGRGAVTGAIQWEAEGLAELRATGAAPALVWLAVGRSLRMVAPVELDAGHVLALSPGDRWVLAPATSGRAMLVPGRGLRIRVAQAARRWTQNRRGV